MLRFLAAVLFGTATIVVWGATAWMILPIHEGTVRPLPNGPAVAEMLVGQNLNDGVYTYPHPDPANANAAAGGANAADPERELAARHLRGPLFSIHYRAAGGPPMPPVTILRGMFINGVAAFTSAILLTLAAPQLPRYAQRVGFVSALAIFAALISHVALSNWMYQPDDYTRAFVIDLIVGWTLVGLVQGALIRPINHDPVPSKN